MECISRLQKRARALKAEILGLYYAFKDKRVRILPKIIIGISILYTLSPIDLIPDFIPILGYLDDLILVPALIVLAMKLIPKDIMEEARTKAKEEPIELKKNWGFALVFIVIWFFVIYISIRALVRILI